MKQRGNRGIKWIFLCLFVVLVVGVSCLQGDVHKQVKAATKQVVPQEEHVKKHSYGIDETKKVGLPDVVSPSSIIKIRSSSGLNKYAGNYGYSKLGTNNKKVYNLASSLAYKFHTANQNATKISYSDQTVGYVTNGIDVASYNIYISDIDKIMFALEADHPMLYWYEGITFTYTTSSFKKGDASDYKVMELYLTVSAPYRAYATRQKTTNAITKSMKAYTDKIDRLKKSGANEMMIELAIHDMIVENVSYSNDTLGNPSEEPWAHNIDGIFTKKKAVCEGYAKSFQMLLNYAGIRSVYAIGWGGGGGHAWNIVCIDGKWYNVDITWNDVAGNNKRYMGGVTYQFFNCLDELFLENHAYDSYAFNEMYSVPTVTKDPKYTYYTYFGLSVLSGDLTDEGKFETKLVGAMKNSSKRSDYVLRLLVNKTDKVKFEKLFYNNYRNLGETASANGSYFAVNDTFLEEYVFTNSSKVYVAYYIPIKRVAISNFAQGVKLIGAPQYTVYEYSGRTRKNVTSTSSYKVEKDRTLIYYQKILLGKYQTSNVSLTIAPIAKQTYTGAAITPVVKVYDGTLLLKVGTDYEVSYKNNSNVGTATIYVVGKGSYVGTKKLSFVIQPKSIAKMKNSAIGTAYYTGAGVKPTVTLTDGKRNLTLNKDVTIRYENNINVGTAKIIATGKGNYNGSKVILFQINKRSLSQCSFSSIANIEYTSKAIKPKMIVKTSKVVLKENVDYSLSYENNTKVGKAKVIVRAKGKNITGSKTLTFHIVPKKVSKLKVKASSRKLVVTWQKSSYASGYEVRYATSKNGSYKSLGTTTKTTFTKTKLTKGKVYYVKVRPFKTIDGKKQFGKFCDSLRITIK